MSRKALGRGLSALFTPTGSFSQDMVELDIDQIDPTNAQPRQRFDENKIEELAQSIKMNGILQPIVVRRNGDRFQIVAGERRWRAAQKAELQKIPCIIKDIPEANVLELSLIENIQREELNPIEEANAYRRLIDQLKLSQEEIAQRVGKDRSSITNSLRLLKLPPELQSLVEDAKLSMGHARALLSLESVDKQLSLASEIIKKALSVRETEKLVKQAHASGSKRPKMIGSGEEVANERANVLAAEQRLSKKLAAPVKIKLSNKGGTVEIKFSSTEDLTRLFDLLMQRGQN
ncbi:MAG: ParB/RepB/Spo0J family partition protein [Blastocatellia bacterium]|nr:ParB/RepB/Spo0J family partition protein [Blastocatellia bacterium]